jgi:hypothetical protein
MPESAQKHTDQGIHKAGKDLDASTPIFIVDYNDIEGVAKPLAPTNATT